MVAGAVNVCFVVVWVVLILRVPIATRNRAAALMWWTTACGTLGVTTGTRDGHAWMTSTCGSEIALVVQTMSITISAMFLISLVRTVSGVSTVTRTLAVSYAASILLVLLPTIVGNDWTSRLPFEAAVVVEQPVPLLWLVHRLTMLSIDMVAIVYAARFCIRYARASSGALSAGLLLIGAGCAFAVAFEAVATTIILVAAAGSDPATLLTLQAGLPAIALMSVIAIVAGCATEPAAQAIRTRRTWRQLRPLWDSLVAVAPDIVMPGTSGRAANRFRLSPRDRLYRRVMEIKDGLLVVRENVPSHYFDTTLTDALLQDTSSARAQITTEAQWVAYAVMNRRQGVHYGASAEPLVRGQMTFDEEVRWLSELSAAHLEQNQQRDRGVIATAEAA